MASFVLGLTKAAVEGTLSRVQTAIDEETKLKVKVQQDLVFITGEFLMMQSFLNVSTKERVKNEVVTTWLRLLRELALDMEDGIELVVHLDKDKSTWCCRILPSCMSPSRPLDEVAIKIKLVRDGVEELSQRNMRYNLILGTETFSGTTAIMPPITSEDTLLSNFQVIRQVWEDAWKIRKVGIKDLIKRDERSTQVISVWENGGNNLEIPYIINQVYCDPEICQLFERRAWVKITRPFNHDEFINTLITQLLYKTGSCDQAPAKDVTNAAEVLQQVTKEQSYLLVLEGVSDVVEWHTARKYLPENNNGSRIIVTTPHLGIGKVCTGQPYLVSEFSSFPSFYAFYKRVPGNQIDMGDLLWKIKRGGLVMVECDDDNMKTAVVKRLWHRIVDGHEKFDGVRFKKYKWVTIGDPFNPMDFWRRVLLDQNGIIPEDYITRYKPNLGGLLAQWLHHIDRVVNMKDAEVMESCRKLLSEDDSHLLVIDGVRDSEIWRSLKETLVSDTIKGCVVAICKKAVVFIKDDIDTWVIPEHQDRYFFYKDEEARAWKSNRSFDPNTRSEEEKHLSIDSPGVFSLWGIAGVGKSTYARYNYYISILNVYKKKAYYCWVDVPHPFCLTELSRRLLFDFHSDDLKAKEDVVISIIEGKDPVQMCRELLHPRVNCLIVFDGLQSTDDWDALKAAFGWSDFSSSKTTILVVTNEESVARHCTGNKSKNDSSEVNNIKKVINLKGLNDDSAFQLFRQKVGNDDRLLENEKLKIAKLIVSKCGGLPKVIVAAAKYCNKELGKYPFDLKPVNDNFISILENNVQEFQSLRGLFSWVQSYLATCKDYLKPCIFYLPVFPTDHNIRRRRLLQRWIAEEENGKGLFSELLNLSIIQKQSTSKFQCRVNGFFHEYITSRPMEDNLVLALEGHCKQNSQRVGRHLSVRTSWDRDKSVFESIDFSRLRSFTVLGEWRPFFMSNPTNNKMRLVRVLDLEDTIGVTDDDLEHIGVLLPLLKFLSLRGCQEITRLPSSLHALRQLQTLDVRHTSIVAFRGAIISKLRNLQYVRAGRKTLWEEGGIMVTCQPPATEPVEMASLAQAQGDSKTFAASLRNMTSKTSLPIWMSKICCMQVDDKECVDVPVAIGNLTALHTFGVINVGARKGIIKELKRLTQLQRLGVSGINVDNIREFFSAISDLIHLQSLTVKVQPTKNKNDYRFACLDGTTSPLPKALKILKLHGHVRILSARWFEQLGNLQKLDLEMTVLARMEIFVLFALPNRDALQRLCVRPIRVTELYVAPNLYLEFYKTKVLEIHCTSELKVIFGGMLHFLEVLKVHCSIGSSFQFSGLDSLFRLKEVWLKGSYSDEVKQNLQRQLDQHERRPILKLLQPRASSFV
ncbi:hypothetical protein PAHAL_3G162800 [Panicum hallii]|uniref:NB-ARC domain-containing protein n=1 Tax=Panicum hallii TaxID=206008 RepID=A0A2S3H9A2_9POAL|nr:hypothetical protein PAHAL_3G162800 [Panicum hallii]